MTRERIGIGKTEVKLPIEPTEEFPYDRRTSAEILARKQRGTCLPEAVFSAILSPLSDTRLEAMASEGRRNMLWVEDVNPSILELSPDILLPNLCKQRAFYKKALNTELSTAVKSRIRREETLSQRDFEQQFWNLAASKLAICWIEIDPAAYLFQRQRRRDDYRSAEQGIRQEKKQAISTWLDVNSTLAEGLSRIELAQLTLEELKKEEMSLLLLRKIYSIDLAEGQTEIEVINRIFQKISTQKEFRFILETNPKVAEFFFICFLSCPNIEAVSEVNKAIQYYVEIPNIRSAILACPGMTYGSENQFCPYKELIPKDIPAYTATKTTPEYLGRLVAYSTARQAEQQILSQVIKLKPTIVVTVYESFINALTLLLVSKAPFITTEERQLINKAYSNFKDCFLNNQQVDDDVFYQSLTRNALSYTSSLQEFLYDSTTIVDAFSFFAITPEQLKQLYINIWQKLPESPFSKGIPKRPRRQIEAFANSTGIPITDGLLVGGTYGAGLGLFLQYQMERVLSGRNGPFILFDPERAKNYAMPVTLNFATAQKLAAENTAVVPLPPYEIMNIIN